LHYDPWPAARALWTLEGLKAFAAKTAAAAHIRQSVKQNTQNWIPPVADKWTQQGAFLSPLTTQKTQNPELRALRKSIHTGAIGNIWQPHTKHSTRCSAVRHSWRSL